MTTQQPIWKLTANLGDVNPLDSGELLYVDATGVYAPELVLIEANLPEDGHDENFSVSRICCDLCYQIGADGVSDNRFHKDSPAWFSDKLAQVERYCGSDAGTLLASLCDVNPVARALGYLCLVAYFGVFEFDQYPIGMTEAEIRTRYADAFSR